MEGSARHGFNHLFTMPGAAVCLDGDASSYGWMDAAGAGKGAEIRRQKDPDQGIGTRRETFSRFGTSFTDRQNNAAFLHSD